VGSPDRHGLDNDYATFLRAQGQMSQWGCGNIFGEGASATVEERRLSAA